MEDHQISSHGEGINEGLAAILGFIYDGLDSVMYDFVVLATFLDKIDGLEIG